MFACTEGPAYLQGIFSNLGSSFMLLSWSAMETGAGIHISEGTGLSIISFFRRHLLVEPLCAISEQKGSGLITDPLFSAVKSCHFEALV